MKTFSGSVRIVWHQLTHQKGLYLALIWGVAIAMFATGCGKKESAAPSATTAAPQQTATQETAAATAPSHPVYTPPAAANLDNGKPILQQLNRSLLQFKIQHNRNPTSVEELAASAGVQIPPPPPGKKYAFNSRGWVVLVDNSTK
jgi:hypothetical protein